MAIHEWMQKDWLVAVNHVHRECNDVACSLAAMGRVCGWHGSTFAGPPENIVARMDDERSIGLRCDRCRAWLMIRADDGMLALKEGMARC
ncbi:hypothetical protein V6N13_036331 [Hibiscus sabdariffa]